MNECECHRCIQENKLTINHPVFGEILLSVTKMILCPECGNKRCPKASDHRLDCTNSNDEGQVKMEVIKATQYDDDPFGRSNTVAIVYRGDDGLRRTGFYTANHADAAEDLIKLLELSIDSQPDRKDFVDVPNEKGGITRIVLLADSDGTINNAPDKCMFEGMETLTTTSLTCSCPKCSPRC